MSMAPNSNMDFVIDWENQELEKGEYVLKMQAQTGEKSGNGSKNLRSNKKRKL